MGTTHGHSYVGEANRFKRGKSRDMSRLAVGDAETLRNGDTPAR
jgi:hypothetical protein